MWIVNFLNVSFESAIAKAHTAGRFFLTLENKKNGKLQRKTNHSKP